MKKRLFAVLCSIAMMAGTAMQMPVSAADDSTFWETFVYSDYEGYKASNTVTLRMTKSQLRMLLKELEPQKETIGEDSVEFNQTFTELLLEKLGLTELYEYAGPEIIGVTNPSKWVEAPDFFKVLDDPGDGGSICNVSVQVHKAFSVKVNDTTVAQTAKDAARRILTYINQYGDKAFFCTASMAYNDPVWDEELWDRFLKYDLCIADFEALPAEEQALAHFIFTTEQSSTQTVRCERARRILAHDPDIGERITLEQAKDCYGIRDWYYDSSYSSHVCLHCVPDIMYMDGFKDRNIFWLDDTGTEYITEQGVQASNEKLQNEMLYTKADGTVEEIPRKQALKIRCDYQDDGTLRYWVDIEAYPDYVEEDGDYYFITPEKTAVLVLSRYQNQHKSRDEIEKQEIITEPVIVPDTVQGCPVTAIDTGAFQNARITEVQLPETVQYIHYGAFMGCESLSKINFPKKLRLIGSRAFVYSALTEITLDAPSLRIADNAFQSCQQMERAAVNIQCIPESAFTGCISLKSVTLGDAVKRIEAKAFKNIGLSEINIPESVEVIGAEAFSEDPPLTISLPPEPYTIVYDSLPAITLPRTVRVLGALAKQQGSPPTSVMYYPPVLPLKEDPVCVFGKDCVISGYRGTEAERYAAEWGLQFIPLDSISGDVNGDGSLTVSDAILLARIIAEDTTVSVTEKGMKHADMNGSGAPDQEDLTLILKQIAGIKE